MRKAFVQRQYECHVHIFKALDIMNRTLFACYKQKAYFLLAISHQVYLGSNLKNLAEA